MAPKIELGDTILYFRQPWLWAPFCGELDYNLSGHVLVHILALHKCYCLKLWHTQWISKIFSLIKIPSLLTGFLETLLSVAYLLDLSGLMKGNTYSIWFEFLGNMLYSKERFQLWKSQASWLVNDTLPPIIKIPAAGNYFYVVYSLPTVFLMYSS